VRDFGPAFRNASEKIARFLAVPPPILIVGAGMSSAFPKGNPDITEPSITAPMGAQQPGRRAVSPGELVRWMSEQLQLVEGCGNVTVAIITPLEARDPDGCNWSRSVVVEPHGTPPHVYALACAEIVEHARTLFNLKSGSGTDF
jgi:hypothetical protein